MNTLTATRWNVYVPRLVDPTVARHVANVTNPGHGCHRPLRCPGPDRRSDVGSAARSRVVSMRTLGPIVGDSEIFLM